MRHPSTAGLRPARRSPGPLGAATLLAWSMLGLLAHLGCTEKVPAPSAPRPQLAVVPDSVQVIFTANCALSGCHAGSDPAGGLNLTRERAYEALVGVASNSCAPLSRVKPFQPDSSCLVKRVEGQVTPQMPPGGSLTSGEQAVIRGWIQQGAGSPVLVAGVRGMKDQGTSRRERSRYEREHAHYRSAGGARGN